MEDFNVPLLTSQSFNDSQTTHAANQLQKDQMLGPSNAIGLSTRTTNSSNFLFDVAENRYNDMSPTSNMKGDLSAFGNCIHPSNHLEQTRSFLVGGSNEVNNLNNTNNIVENNIDGVSVTSLCDFKFPSPSSLNNTLNNETNFKNITPLLSRNNNDINSTDSTSPVSSFSTLLFVPSNRDQNFVDLEPKTNTNVIKTPHLLPMKSINSGESRYLQRQHSHQLLQNDTFPNTNHSNDGSNVCGNGTLALPSIQSKSTSVTTPSNGNISNYLSTNISSSVPPVLVSTSDSSLITSLSSASLSTTNLNNFNSIPNNVNYIITSSPSSTSPLTTSGSILKQSSPTELVTVVSAISTSKIPNNCPNKKCDPHDNQITTTNTINKNTANDATRISVPNNYPNNTNVGMKNQNDTNMIISNHLIASSNLHHEKNNITNFHLQQQQQRNQHQISNEDGNLVTSHHSVSSLHNIEELAVSSCSSSSISCGGTSSSLVSGSSSPPVTTSASIVGMSTIPKYSNKIDSLKYKTTKLLTKSNPPEDIRHQQQVQQQNQMQLAQLQPQNGQDFSINSSECESMSSDDDSIDLEINEGTSYHDNTSSHSQHSNAGSGGGGGGNSGNNGNNNPNASSLQAAAQAVIGGNASNYMSLLPPTNASGHLLTSAGNGNGTSTGGLVTTGVGGTSASSGGTTGESIDFKHLFEELCPVCGDKVSGYHYGLLTCESCKGFFKRTVQNKKVYTCVAERSCHIDKTQRKRCPYCRFQKCLEVGMKLEAVRADRMRGGRNKFGPMYKRDRARKLQIMRQRQLALQAIRTTMSTADMKATPLSPGYQQAYPNMNIKQEIQIPQVSSLTQSPDSSPSPIAIALGQVNASSSVITTAMNGSSGNGNGGSSGGGGNSNSDIINRSNSGNCHDPGSLPNSGDSKLCFDSGTHPSSTADSSIEPLRVSPMIRDFVQSIDDREWQTQLFALLQKQTYNQVEVDLFELMCKVLDQNLFSQVDWARNTAFFKDLKVDDQMKLLQNSWSDMLVLDHLHQRIHNGLPDETQLNNGQVFNLLGLGLLGVPQLADYFNDLQNKLQDLKFDMGDYVCMKFLILLNPNVRGIINKKTVLEGHENVQAALLDYTLTCYPSVTNKFTRLLNILPEIHDMAARGEEHLYSKHCAGSAPTQTLLMEMLHAKRKV